ncbi:LLM class flavin-dependent oxidoreductase [Actinophytocola sp.]|uniref:LLM class flavin-dependent oxidoreductase n=1 Tax=Actinophytocola sp. TaxID=1872138 RepID=UPI003D6AF343
MVVKFGAGPFNCQSDDGGPAAGRLQSAIPEWAEVAEAEGLDGFWLAEHHFSPDGYSSSIFPLLGAVAARTSRITIGTKVLLAPLYHPLRLAEDAAQVAGLSAGRFILGVALGYRPEEYAAFGVDRRRRAALLEDAVAVCRAAWRGERFDYRSRLIDLRDIVCRPAPEVAPPIFLGGKARAALVRAARIADGYIPSSGADAEILDRVGTVDREAGDRGPLPLVTGVMAAVSTDAVESSSLVDGVRQVLSTYEKWLESAGDTYTGSAGLDPASSYVANGGPDDVARVVARIAASFPGRTQHLTARLDYPGMSRDDVTRHIRRYAREVVPRVREMIAV